MATPVDWEDAELVARVARRLRAALEDNPPTSLTQVAKELRCARGTLRKKFPALAAQVAAKADVFYRPTVSDERMREALSATLADISPPSLEAVSQRLGAGASVATLHKRFPEESRKIVERYCTHKKRRLDHDGLEKTLRAAVEKTPPPSMPEVSRQLGVAKATLYSKFPELCNAISGRFAAHRREKSESNRTAAKAEIRAICERAVQEGIYPSFALVRSRLSMPCQSEAFSKIRRDVLAEMDHAFLKA
jgi:AcrR family transcriptional regulator